MRIIIAEDHALYREVIGKCCAETGNEVLGCFETARDALKACLHGHPDLVILDLRLKDGPGGVVLDVFEDGVFAPRVLVISGYLAPYLVHRLDRLPAPTGFIHKAEATIGNITSAILALSLGQRWLSAAYLNMQKEMRWGAPSFVDNLTRRQQELLRYVAMNASDEEIAMHLSISVRTIEGHRSNLMYKLGVDNSLSLASHAREMGFDLFPPSGNLAARPHAIMEFSLANGC